MTTCTHYEKNSCPHLFINGEDRGSAEAMLFVAGAFCRSVSTGKETREDAVARLLSTPERRYEIRYLPDNTEGSPA